MCKSALEPNTLTPAEQGVTPDHLQIASFVPRFTHSAFGGWWAGHSAFAIGTKTTFFQPSERFIESHIERVTLQNRFAKY